MSRSFTLSDALHEYVTAHSFMPDPVLAGLAERTRALGDVSGMQIGPEQGALLTTLTHLVDARFAVEIGTFTGYSSICIARGLAPGGRLLCCDVSEEWTAIAREAWAEAGIDDRIDLVIAPAERTLAGLDESTVVDLAFIDADKGGYRTYLDQLLPHLSDRGVIVVDNVLWSGRVLEDDGADANRDAIKAFNDHVAARDDCRAVMLPVGDGITLITTR